MTAVRFGGASSARQEIGLDVDAGASSPSEIASSWP